MKTDIWVECSAKIIKKKRIYKYEKLSIFCASITCRSLAQFDKCAHLFSAKTLTFPIGSFFMVHSTFGSLGFFCYLYVKLSRSTSPLKGGRTRENIGITVMRAMTFNPPSFSKKSDVHMYTARCLYRVCKGFEGLTSKQPCKAGTAPKSHSP